ncbi:MAG: hypothetical protein CM1200mP24_02310 [Gammaproteobacteria bacterium]|nr:MAG: hypothetical protein CM1200mP24_02310 [Gammaproteobacteria bacterium]
MGPNFYDGKQQQAVIDAVLDPMRSGVGLNLSEFDIFGNPFHIFATLARRSSRILVLLHKRGVQNRHPLVHFYQMRHLGRIR